MLELHISMCNHAHSVYKRQGIERKPEKIMREIQYYDVT